MPCITKNDSTLQGSWKLQTSNLTSSACKRLLLMSDRRNKNSLYKTLTDRLGNVITYLYFSVVMYSVAFLTNNIQPAKIMFVLVYFENKHNKSCTSRNPIFLLFLGTNRTGLVGTNNKTQPFIIMECLCTNTCLTISVFIFQRNFVWRIFLFIFPKKVLEYNHTKVDAWSRRLGIEKYCRPIDAGGVTLKKYSPYIRQRHQVGITQANNRNIFLSWADINKYVWICLSSWMVKHNEYNFIFDIYNSL